MVRPDEALINQNPEIPRSSPLESEGSDDNRRPLVIPIGKSLLYVQPLSESENGELPELKRVIVSTVAEWNG